MPLPDAAISARDGASTSAATSTRVGDRLLIALSAGVALYAIFGRIHNVATFPAMADWDASGHAASVLDVLDMHLPNLRSWAGTHPPLYYVLGAALCRLLPESVPMHVTLRLLSAGAWVATIGLVWRSLRRLVSPVDAAVVSAFLLGVPGIVIITCMMTNDTVCVFLVTATLVRLFEAPHDGPAPIRHVVVTALLAGLAALAKATGIPAIAMAAGVYAWRARHTPWLAVRNVLLVGGVAAAVAAPHYARVAITLAGSQADELAPEAPSHLAPYDKLAGFSGSKEKEAISLVVLEVMLKQAPPVSSATLFQQAIWGDPTAVFLPRDPRIPTGLLAAAGLVVLGLALVGAARLLVRHDIARRSGVVLTFGLLYGAALVPPSLIAPYMVLTKTNFFLPLVLPVGMLLAIGFDGLRGAARTALRVVLLVIAAGGVAVTWYGWWQPAQPAQPPSPAPATRNTSASPPVRAVERYFAYRARDPIRAVLVTSPEVQLGHELRLVRIFGVPFTPELGLTADDERSIELARARQASLELYNLMRWMAPVAGAMHVDVLDVEQQDEAADVRVRVSAAGPTPPRAARGLGPWPFAEFTQRFGLRRSGGEWRITSIEQTDISDANAVPAFAADATLRGLDRLRALGWSPGKDWEDAVAASVRSFPGLR